MVKHLLKHKKTKVGNSLRLQGSVSFGAGGSADLYYSDSFGNSKHCCTHGGCPDSNAFNINTETYQDGEMWFKFHFILNSSYCEHAFQVKDTTANEHLIPQVSATELPNSYTVTVYIRGLQGEPTYLETLDKLDQWSSAQYVPYGNSGNILNNI